MITLKKLIPYLDKEVDDDLITYFPKKGIEMILSFGEQGERINSISKDSIITEQGDSCEEYEFGKHKNKIKIFKEFKI